MVLRLFLTVSSAVLLMSSPMTNSATAQAGGLEFLHDKVLIGGHVCMKDHTHTGKGGDAHHSIAVSKAARDWSEFTALEYGAAWANFGIAAGKSMSCGQLRDAWMCEIVAVPCRM
jgi:hypothetical protein